MYAGMSYLMTMGRPDASVALFLPSSSMWLGDDAADTQFVSTERLLSEHQIDFDIVDEDALARDLKAVKGSFETLSGNRYRTVILPAPSLLSSEMPGTAEGVCQGRRQGRVSGRRAQVDCGPDDARCGAGHRSRFLVGNRG